MMIREYNPADLKALAALFYDTVHTVNARDYTPEQLNVWATGEVNLEKWGHSFEQHHTLLAEADGTIIGFGDIDDAGYLDRLYVHKDYQRQGVATAICDKLEQYTTGNVTVYASITAKPFFAHRGYSVVKEQAVERGGVMLTNFKMCKERNR